MQAESRKRKMTVMQKAHEKMRRFGFTRYREPVEIDLRQRVRTENAMAVRI